MKAPRIPCPILAITLASLLVGTSFPWVGHAQTISWTGQGDVLGGWYSPTGERAGVRGIGNVEGPVRMASSVAFAGRLFFPVMDTDSWYLGKVSLGARAIVVPGAELELVESSGEVGTADRFEFLGTVSIGDFLSPNATGINLRINGMVGFGFGHTAYHLDPGVDWTEGKQSVTGAVFNATLGGDVVLTPWMSLVAYGSWSWGKGTPGHGSVAERAFTALGGLAFRWPFRRGSRY
jgi:hypothetical protein